MLELGLRLELRLSSRTSSKLVPPPVLILLAWLWLWACCWHVLGLELWLGPRLVLELESLLGLAQ